jgi:hypothetical protein
MADARFVLIADPACGGESHERTPVSWRPVAANYRVLARLAGFAPNESVLFSEAIRAADPHDGLLRYPPGGGYFHRRSVPAMAHIPDIPVES